MDKTKNIEGKSRPVELSPEQKKLAKKLDIFCKRIGRGSKTETPQEILQGIAYLRLSEPEANPDKRSHITHSCRELLYTIIVKDKENISNKDKLKRILEKQGINFSEQILDNVIKSYNKLTDIAHHAIQPKSDFSPDKIKNLTEEEFDSLIEEFLNNLSSLFQGYRPDSTPPKNHFRQPPPPTFTPKR